MQAYLQRLEIHENHFDKSKLKSVIKSAISTKISVLILFFH